MEGLLARKTFEIPQSAGSPISQDCRVERRPPELIKVRERLLEENARGAMIIGSVAR